MPDVSVQVREYFEYMTDHVTVEEVTQRPAAFEPVTPRRRGWVVAAAAAVVVLLLIGGVAWLVRSDPAPAPADDLPAPPTFGPTFFASEPGVVRYPSSGGWESLAVGPDGALWLTRGAEGAPAPLWRFDGNTWTRYGAEDGLPALALVVDIEVAANGTVWVVHEDGVSRLDATGWVTHHHGGMSLRVAAVAPDGSLWAAVDTLGEEGPPGIELARFTDVSDYRSYPLGGDLIGLAVGPDGDIWVAEDLGWTAEIQATRVNSLGLRRFDGEAWAEYVMPSDLLPDGIEPWWSLPPFSMTVAQDGSVWITSIGPSPIQSDGGLFQGLGVVRFDGANWTYFGEDNGLHRGLPIDIVASPDGTVWAASPGVWVPTSKIGDIVLDVDLVGGGLFRYTHDQWEKVLDEPAYRLAVGPNGEVWVRNEGLWARLVP